ncbi:MAG: T9SS type A sorting domain-containing protein [Bacteroidetes bacterium]|nr:T9SS type A sorting domain-containing protein [Bacteroidota bacterium]
MYHNPDYLNPKESQAANLENRPFGCIDNDLNYSEIITRKSNANNLRVALLPNSHIDSIKHQIDFLEDFVEIENANAVKYLLTNDTTDYIYTYLKNNNTPQDQLLLAELYLDDGKYDSAQMTLNQISINDQTSYHYLNQQFLSKIANHFASANDLCNFSTIDLTYFENLANTYSPTAFRAESLLELIDSVCTNKLLSAKNSGDFPTYKYKAIVGPNPSSDIILINQRFKNEEYKIFDIVGKVVKEGRINLQNKLIVEDLKEGIYQLQILDTNGNAFSEKFIKN